MTTPTANTNTLKTPIKTYHPENDSEAMAFINTWCKSCAKSANDQFGFIMKSSCPILHKADQNDEFTREYPIQWQRNGLNKGMCTGYIKSNQNQSLSPKVTQLEHCTTLCAAASLLNQ